MKIIGWGWKGLYEQVKKLQEVAHEYKEFLLVTTVYAGRPWKYKGTYAVVLRVGWEEVVEGGTVAGLTLEQWAFLHCTSPKVRAILAIGPEWPGLKEAIEIAQKAYCRVNKYCIKFYGIEI